MGETPDISEWTDFSFYQWVWFYAPGDFASEGQLLGRWLGVSHRIGQAMTYFVLPISGKPISRSTVKAVSDVYAPVTGIVKEVNDELPNSPEVLNQEPYGDGWLVIMELSHKDELDNLLTAEDYQALIDELS